MERVTISPQMFSWALERAGIEADELSHRVPHLPDWQTGAKEPTLKQLEDFAKAVHVPIGYLFLSEPPDEKLPIPDFRTFGSRPVTHPSPNLLDMVYCCQERQDWYRDFAQFTQLPERQFIGSAKITELPARVAEDIRTTLDFDLERYQRHTKEEAFKFFLQKAESAGVLVMVSSVVLSNTSRKLDLQEFRGFALADRLAPLIFINGADSKSGQVFTLAHELAHLWINASGLSNAEARPLSSSSREEIWCNKVAAELLVPLDALHLVGREDEFLDEEVEKLSNKFKVSKLVILRRLLDKEYISRKIFEEAWDKEMEFLRSLPPRKGGGGNFYPTTILRVGRRFISAITSSTLEGQTLYRDAFRMLGISKTSTLNNLKQHISS